MFPPLSGVQNQPSTQQEFSTFAFWREPIIDLRLSKAVEAAAAAAEAEASTEVLSEPAMAAVVDAAVRKDRDEKAVAAKDSKIA